MPNTNTYIGADLHKKTCYVTVMDRDGQIKKQKEIATDTLKIANFFKHYNGASVAVESTMNWMPFYENLESLGCKVNLSNPLQTKAIASAKIKNDKVDSRVLADLLRTNMLPLAYIQPRAIRDLKELIRQRAHYVELRTRIKNKIHSIIFKTNTVHDFKNLYTKEGMEFLKTVELRKVYRDEMDRYLKTLELLNEQIKEIEVIIEKTAQADYDCQLLMTIPGVGYYTALMIKSEIGDIERFSNANKLCSYAGITPATYQSANKIRYGQISKRGSRWLRLALIYAVTAGTRNDNKISVYYKKLKKKKGTGKAKVAAARKLCTVIFAILTDKQPYQEFTPVKRR